MKYRLPELDDKEQVLSYIEDHYSSNERSLSASNGLTSMKYENWVQKVHDNVNTPDEVWGKSITYFVFDNDKLIGLLNIRFDLSEELASKYGHIGYGVRPSERRKGYATKMLEFALEECKRLRMNKVILGCYKNNTGSAKTIIKNGGKLIKEIDSYQDISEFWKINLVNQFYEVEID